MVNKKSAPEKSKIINIVPVIKSGVKYVPRPKSKTRAFTMMTVPDKKGQRGGFGDYSRAHGIYTNTTSQLKTQTKGGRLYALKTIRRNAKCAEKEQIDMAVNEVKALRKYYRLGISPGASLHIGKDNEGNLYIYIRPALGQTSEKLLKKSSLTLPLSTRLDIVKSLQQSLKIIHEQQELHNDLSNRNFLIELTEDKQFKKLLLIDFGMTTSIKQAREDAENGARHGAPGYAPLEMYQMYQRNMPTSYDPVSHELYAAGVSMLEILTGKSIRMIYDDAYEAIAKQMLLSLKSYFTGVSEDFYDKFIRGLRTIIKSYYAMGTFDFLYRTNSFNEFYRYLGGYFVKNNMVPKENIVSYMESLKENLQSQLQTWIEEACGTERYEFEGRYYPLPPLSRQLLKEFDAIKPQLEKIISEEAINLLEKTLVKSQLSRQLGGHCLKLREFHQNIENIFSEENKMQDLFSLFGNDLDLSELAPSVSMSGEYSEKINDLTDISEFDEFTISTPKAPSLISGEAAVEVDNSPVIVEPNELRASALAEVPAGLVSESNNTSSVNEATLDYYRIFEILINNQIKISRSNLNTQISELKKDVRDAKSFLKIKVLQSLQNNLEEVKNNILSKAKDEFQEINNNNVTFDEKNNLAVKKQNSLSQELDKKLYQHFLYAAETEGLNEPRSWWQQKLVKYLNFTKAISKPFHDWITKTATKEKLENTYKETKQNMSYYADLFLHTITQTRSRAAMKDNQAEARPAPENKISMRKSS